MYTFFKASVGLIYIKPDLRRIENQALLYLRSTLMISQIMRDQRIVKGSGYGLTISVNT